MMALYNIRGLILALLVGSIVGLGVGIVISTNTPSEKEVNEEKLQEEGDKEDTAQKEAVTALSSGENILVVNSQRAGEHVIVSMIALDRSGWVAVHEVLDNKPSPVILGAARFGAGKHFGEKINLLRATQAETFYMLVLHADDGDSEFDFKKEIPVADEKGEILAEEFFVTPKIEE
ncbi:MAG: hypothetical protein WD003_00100 [Candidatus Paceibacterota bacterium]